MGKSSVLDLWKKLGAKDPDLAVVGQVMARAARDHAADQHLASLSDKEREEALAKRAQRAQRRDKTGGSIRYPSR